MMTSLSLITQPPGLSSLSLTNSLYLHIKNISSQNTNFEYTWRGLNMKKSPKNKAKTAKIPVAR